MSGHHSFSQLRAQLSDERKERIAKKTDQLRQEMALYELRPKGKSSTPIQPQRQPSPP